MSVTVMMPEKKSTEMVVIGEKIDQGMEAFNERKADLMALKSEAEGLKITSIDDKANIATVSTIRKKLKSARVEIEKEAKGMRDRLTNINRTISEKERELIDIIEPTEKELLKQEKWVEEEKERIRLEAEAAEKARVQKRIDRLAAYGYAVDLAFLTTIPDESFEKVVENARIEHEKELAIKAEEDRLQKLENQRLIDERKELEELRKKQAESQRIIDEHNEKIRLEQEQKEQAIRDEQNKIAEEKRAIELQKQKDLEEKQRAIELEEARKEAAEKERLRLIEQEKQNKILETEKLAMASDKVKFQTVIDQLTAITIPEMKSAKAKKLSGEVTQLISKVVEHVTLNIGKKN